MKMVSFVNKEYKKDWDEWVPGYEGEVRFSDGTYVLMPNGDKTVFDGATNYMGIVKADGTMESNGPAGDDYYYTFLRAARDN